MKLDNAVVSAFRAPFHSKNDVWCPDEKIRLKIIVETHFIERFIQRFKSSTGANLLKQIFDWIDANYCMLLFESRIGVKKYRVNFDSGTVAFAVFDNILRVRTCFVLGENDE